MLAFEQDAADAVLVACPVPVLAALAVVLPAVDGVLELMLEQPVSSPRPTAAATASVLCRIFFPSPASGSQRSPTFVVKL
jgi:hypothetical protein